MEFTKEISLQDGIRESIDRANKLKKSILFSYTFRFEIRDLLPVLTLPTDKNTIRIYWQELIFEILRNW